jgi:hypothetical protein
LAALPSAKYTRGDGGRGTANRWTATGLKQFNKCCERVGTDREKDTEGSFDTRFSVAAAEALQKRKKTGNGRSSHDVIKMYNDLGRALTSTPTATTVNEAAAK